MNYVAAEPGLDPHVHQNPKESLRRWIAGSIGRKAPLPGNDDREFGTLSRIARDATFVASSHTNRHTPRMPKPTTHDAYIAAAPEPFCAMLTRLRAQLAKALPDAEEVIKYDMPGFQIGDTIVAGYAAFSKQCGLYVDTAAITEHADAIAALKLKATKSGVTFSAARPISDELVAKLAVSSRKSKGL